MYTYYKASELDGNPVVHPVRDYRTAETIHG